MYYPLQIPYLLDETFSSWVRYRETVSEALSPFVICHWEMQAPTMDSACARNIIVADGCIDLVVDFDGRQIGFSGMRQTVFDDTISGPCYFFGARMKPGAFSQMTGLPASTAMNQFLPLCEVFPDFDADDFFSRSFSQAQDYFADLLLGLWGKKVPDLYTTLFDALYEDGFLTVSDLAAKLHMSARQCQRQFSVRFGLTPKMVLSILRFQKCLEILTSDGAGSSEVLAATDYYDQPHFIRDFKANLGITPLELLRRYRA